MKKKIAMLAVLVMAVIASAYSVSGTYAKYTNTSTGTDSARVAKWKFNQTQNIANLFTASYAASDDDSKSDVSSSVDVVAPGTSGQYTFTLGGVTETNYTIEANVLANDTINTAEYAPIKYTLDTTEITDLNNDNVVNAEDLALAIKNLYDSSKVYAAGTVSESAHTIKWSWAINGDDAKDTVLGNEIVEDGDSHKVSLSVTITATQSEKAATN